jgi:hypothetical protein
MSLADVQRSIATVLLTGDPGEAAAHFEETRRPARIGLNLYRDSILAGLIGVLSARFPETRRMLGEAPFAAAARDFVCAHPPRSPLLSAYGRDFADFLGSRSTLSDPARSEESARREWNAR